MVSDWIIIGAMLVLGAGVVLFLRSGPGDDISAGPSRSAGKPKASSSK